MANHQNYRWKTQVGPEIVTDIADRSQTPEYGFVNTVIGTENKGLITHCAVEMCLSHVVDDYYCTAHQDEERENYLKGEGPKCAHTGCLSREQKGGYCLDHWKEKNPTKHKQKLRICGLPGCLSQNKKNGFCEKHFNQFSSTRLLGCQHPRCNKRRVKERLCISHWKENNPGKDYIYKNRSCEVSDCTNKIAKQGLCEKHWNRSNLNLSTCRFPRCTKFKAKQGLKKGLCVLHWEKLNPKEALRQKKEAGKICIHAECTNKPHTDQYCCQHYKELNPDLIPLDICNDPNCMLKQYREGLCSRHYKESCKKLDVIPENRCEDLNCLMTQFEQGTCCLHYKGLNPDLIKIDTCENQTCLLDQFAEGLCLTHWTEQTQDSSELFANWLDFAEPLP